MIKLTIPWLLLLCLAVILALLAAFLDVSMQARLSLAAGATSAIFFGMAPLLLSVFIKRVG